MLLLFEIRIEKAQVADQGPRNNARCESPVRVNPLNRIFCFLVNCFSKDRWTGFIDFFFFVQGRTFRLSRNRRNAINSKRVALKAAVGQWREDQEGERQPRIRFALESSARTSEPGTCSAYVRPAADPEIERERESLARLESLRRGLEVTKKRRTKKKTKNKRNDGKLRGKSQVRPHGLNR